MKNMIPLLIASVVAAMAVALVWHRLGRVERDTLVTERVWVARRGVGIRAGDVINEGNAEQAERVSSALPRQAFRGTSSPLGSRATRAVEGGDYILRDGVSDESPAPLEPSERENCLTTVTFSDATLGRLLRAGAYITIVGLETAETVSPDRLPRDLSADAASPTAQARTVYTLRPVLSNIRVRQVLNGGAGVLLELSQRDAQTVLWAQRTMELYPWIVRDGATMKPETVTADELERRIRALN